MRLSVDYRRVAVRPFPFTEEIRWVINRSMSNLRSLLLESSEFINWSGGVKIFEGAVDTEVGSLVLSVYMRDDGFSDECYGAAHFGYLKEGKLRVGLGKKILGLSEDILNSRAFWLDIKTVLHHELIHVFDPKNLREELEKKWKYYQSHDRGMYFKNPTEISAYEGSFYYYFKDKAESGMGLQEAVREFLSEGYRGNERSYMKSIRWNKVKWRKYVERIYKSAQQAYSDFKVEA